ncbi:hypothetical protein AB0I61_27785 [Polymorphospora rubra]|uniref:hypothetical protein n=1 Tax=Polymorphospora rubra TaxID=338584 RepID=UPI0033EDB248
MPVAAPSPVDETVTLLTAGERLGWVFRDRNTQRRPFPEMLPLPPPPPVDLSAKVLIARARLPRNLFVTAGSGLAAATILACVGSMAGDLFRALGTVSLLAGFGAAAGVLVRYGALRSRADRTVEELRQGHERAKADWAARKATFERRETDRVDALPEWGAVSPGPGARRVDVVGGNLWGWEALLTVCGTSLLATRGPMVMVDLSGEAVSRELLRVAAANGLTADLLLLPDELADSDLLVGLTPRQLVDSLVESIHSGQPPTELAGRLLDDRILTAVCAALGEHISMARLAAALRVLMNEPGDTPELTPEERRHVADRLFGDEYRRHAHQHLSRLESFVEPLAPLGTRRDARPPAALTCLALATGGRTVRAELLDDLVVQWLIRRIAHGPARPGSLVVAGADDLPARHVERLGDLCERRGVRLVLLHRHLRGPVVQAIGAGTVGFMRLGNHEEARHAADFVGREHRFVLSQLTRTLGGNETHTVADTEGASDTEGHGTGWGTSDGTGRGGGRGSTPTTWSRNRGRNLSESANWSVTRNWSRTRSLADGTNWSDAESRQRVYEYAVEPRTFQELPDYALILVRRDDDGATVVPTECNPDLVTLPRVGMGPLPSPPEVTGPAVGGPTAAAPLPAAPPLPLTAAPPARPPRQRPPS